MSVALPPGTSEAATAAMASDPLQALRGLHLPQAVGLWPLAPGWWMALVIAAGIALAVWFFMRARRASLAHHALAEVDRLDSENADLQPLAGALSEVLRRVALRRFGNERVASLHGESWQKFLSATSPQRKRRRASFSPEMVALLARAPYAPPGELMAETADGMSARAGVLAASRDWIRWNA